MSIIFLSVLTLIIIIGVMILVTNIIKCINLAVNTTICSIETKSRTCFVIE